MGKNNRLKFKHITKNEGYLDHVKEQLEKGNSITNSVRDLCDKFGLEYSDNLRRRFSERLARIGAVDKEVKSQPIEYSDEYQEALKRKVKKSKYYLISSCQANSEVHKGLWKNMKAFAEHIGAEILLQPSRYKNPTSLESNSRIKGEEQGNRLWSGEVREHLYAKDIKLNKYLTALMSIKIQPTAKLPLSGTNGFTGDSSAIIPHPKMHLESVPVLPGTPSKLLLTTGSVTLPQYTDTKIGYESKWAHTLGFVLAEVVNDKKYFVHQVSADDSGAFFFLDYEVSGGKVIKYDVEYPAITLGDIHYGETDTTAYNTSVDIINRLRAKNVFLHDVGNMHSISHHDLKSPLRVLQKEEEGLDSLQKELDLILSELDKLDGLVPYSRLHVVESNHPLWIERWLNSADWRKVNNKKLFLGLAYMVSSGETEGKGVLNHLISEAHPTINTYTEDDSIRIHGFEMLIHGHLGNAGSRGSINQYKGLSFKSISAHNHTPKRVNGTLSAGTLTILKPDYVKGLSAWGHSNVLIAPNGKATHLHIIDGEYSTL